MGLVKFLDDMLLTSHLFFGVIFRPFNESMWYHPVCLGRAAMRMRLVLLPHGMFSEYQQPRNKAFEEVKKMWAAKQSHLAKAIEAELS